MPLAELKLIERLRRQAARNQAGSRRVRTGIGDDCGVLAGSSSEDWLLSTDMSVEGVHFRRDWHPARAVGHRCLARGLSDIAAMGGEPVAAFLSLALPRRTAQRWVDGFMEGFLALARRAKIGLAGGDTAESKAGIAADVVVAGTAPRGQAILRSGARPGDLIYVSGRLGSSAAALAELRGNGRGEKPTSAKEAGAGQRAAYLFPQPRLAQGRWLRQRGLATSMIDLSDGLSTDLAHICTASGVGALLDEAAIPRAGAGAIGLQFALHGGEDYELLFTAGPKRKIPANIGGVKATRIGKIIRRRGVWLAKADSTVRKLRPGGWQHFEGSR